MSVILSVCCATGDDPPLHSRSGQHHPPTTQVRIRRGKRVRDGRRGDASTVRSIRRPRPQEDSPGAQTQGRGNETGRHKEPRYVHVCRELGSCSSGHLVMSSLSNCPVLLPPNPAHYTAVA